MSDRRAEIITAARELMTDSGPNGVSVRAVAAHAGIGASTLRHYFPTQQALYEAALGDALDQQVLDLRIADPTVDARGRLTECLWQFLSAPTDTELSRQQWLATITAMVDPIADPEHRRLWEHLVHHSRTRLIAWLEVLDQEGRLVHDDINRAARFLLAVIDGAALGLIVTGQERLPTEHARQILDDAVATVVTAR